MSRQEFFRSIRGRKFMCVEKDDAGVVTQVTVHQYGKTDNYDLFTLTPHVRAAVARGLPISLGDYEEGARLHGAPVRKLIDVAPAQDVSESVKAETFEEIRDPQKAEFVSGPSDALVRRLTGYFALRDGSLLQLTNVSFPIGVRSTQIEQLGVRSQADGSHQAVRESEVLGDLIIGAQTLSRDAYNTRLRAWGLTYAELNLSPDAISEAADDALKADQPCACGASHGDDHTKECADDWHPEDPCEDGDYFSEERPPFTRAQHLSLSATVGHTSVLVDDNNGTVLELVLACEPEVSLLRDNDGILRRVVCMTAVFGGVSL